MARINSYEDLSSWIDKQKTFIDGCKYGRNRRSLLQGIDEQRKWSTEVVDMDSKVTQILNRTYDADKKKRLLDAYENLKAVVEKKLHCLETMLEVSSLEENCNRLSRDFDLRSVDLVKAERSHWNDGSPGKSTSSTESLSSVDAKNLQGFIATTAQDCINGLRNNWDWVAKLVKCIDIHLKNSSDYQQFYHEVQESEPWMLADFNRFSKAFDNQSSKAEKDDVGKLAADLDSIYVSLRQWEAKTNRLLNTASRLVPVPLRTDGTTEPTPATALCDYETKDISFSYGEDLLLLDNSNPDSWKVRNGKNEEAEVPPVIVLIPGPSKDAIDIATKLQLQLLTAWTNALKRIGVRLICHMLTVFKPQYKPQEIAALTSMEDIDKEHLLQLLSHIEDTLRKHWSDQEGFVSLQERLLALRMALEEVGDGEQKDPDLYKSLIIEITALGQLMNIYQDMFKDWEKFKVAVESSRAPDLMLIVDKWEQLQFVSRDYFSKFWKLKLPLDERERAVMRGRNFTLDGVQFEDTIDLLSPRPDSARLSLESTDGLQRAGATIVRRLNLDEKTGSHDEVFNDEKSKSVVTSVIETRKWVTVDDGRKEQACNGRKVEETMQKMLGKDSGDGWNNEEGFDETKIKTMTTKILGNAHQVNAVKGSPEDWNREGGFDETRTVTTTNLRYGTQTVEGVVGKAAVEELGEGSMEDGFSETRTRTVITDGVTFGRAAVDSDGKGGKRESPARAVRRLQSSQSSFPEVEEAGFEELGELEFTHNRLSSSEYEGAQFGIASETKTAETEQLSSAEMEEKKTFVIKSVINPNDKTDISLQQAIMLGVIRPNEGVYVNSVSGDSLPIATAMSDGLIRVMFSTTKRTPEKFSSIGIITVKTVRKLPRPCIIVSVKDSVTKEELTQEEAHRRGLLDDQQGCYTDRLTGKKLMIAEAVEKGLMAVEFCGDPPEPEVISKTYAVRAVVDRRQKKTITFHEAVRRGIIDKESGAFKDTISNEKMYVGDAIMRGFLKARVIEDAHGLNIDPENKMVIDKTQKIRERLLKPLKVISAFKMAAKDGLKK